MRWWMNAATQWTLARVPGGRFAHGLLQEHSGELSCIECSSRFDNAEFFLRAARRWCGELGDLHVVELGTGWVPAVPLALLACGARVETYDVARLVKPRFFRRTRDEVRRRAGLYAVAADLPVQTVLRRLNTIADARDLETGCPLLGGRCVAPCDTRHLPYSDDEVDLVVSNLVLQCIEPQVLRDVLAESLRVLRPGGFAIHRIRMSDEYAPCDRRRNHLAYLKYSRRAWDRWFNHDLKYVNRLRASQFLELFRETGFDCRQADGVVDEASIPFLRSLKLAPEFRDLELHDLATVNLDVALQKPVMADVSDAPDWASPALQWR